MGKRYRTERRRIDPREVAVVIHDEAAVEFYKTNPNGTYDRGFLASNGGRPSVGRGRGGRLVAWQGNHRIAAAAAEGRSIDVDFQVEIGSEDDKRSDSFFAWMWS
jgi:hypothetical protein